MISSDTWNHMELNIYHALSDITMKINTVTEPFPKISKARNEEEGFHKDFDVLLGPELTYLALSIPLMAKTCADQSARSTI